MWWMALVVQADCCLAFILWWQWPPVARMGEDTEDRQNHLQLQARKPLFLYQKTHRDYILNIVGNGLVFIVWVFIIVQLAVDFLIAEFNSNRLVLTLKS